MNKRIQGWMNKYMNIRTNKYGNEKRYRNQGYTRYLIRGKIKDWRSKERQQKKRWWENKSRRQSETSYVRYLVLLLVPFSGVHSGHLSC
jgi:hypothetical protein